MRKLTEPEAATAAAIDDMTSANHERLTHRGGTETSKRLTAATATLATVALQRLLRELAEQDPHRARHCAEDLAYMAGSYKEAEE